MMKHIFWILFLLCFSKSISGQSWNELTLPDISSASRVNEIYTDTINNELYLGVDYNSLGIARLYKWNGFSFTQIGSDINGTISAIGIFQDTIYLGGGFSSPYMGGMIRWVDTSWQTPGSGMWWGTVEDFAVFHDTLYAAGLVENLPGYPGSGHPFVVRMKGNAWENVKGDFDQMITCMEVYNDELYIGGTFIFYYRTDTAPSGAPSFYMPRIAKLTPNGWVSVGNGLSNDVIDMKVWNNKLYVAGTFQNEVSASTPLRGIASWDGSTWQPLAGGLNSTGNCLGEYNGNLVCGGNFTTADGQIVNRVASWNGSVWSSFGNGFESQLLDVDGYNGVLYSAGYFTLSGTDTVRYLGTWPASLAGLNEVKNKNFVVYPNPSTGNFTIKLNQILKIENIIVRDIQGKCVFRKEITKETDFVELKLSEASGIYFVEVEAAEFVIREKIIIE
jgi:hypothetical protein